MMDEKVIKEKKALRYVVAHEQIKALIQEEGLQRGDKLPGENELAARLGISRGTLRQALMLLRESGIIYNHQGKGNFICGGQRPAAGLERARCDLMDFATVNIEERKLIVEYIPSTNTVRDFLELPETTLLAQFYIQYLSGGQIIAYRLAFIPFQRLGEAGVALDSDEALLTFVDECLHGRAAKVQTSFSCIEAREAVAENMGVPSGTKVIYFSEITRDKTDQAAAYSKLYCHSDYFQFNMTRE